MLDFPGFDPRQGLASWSSLESADGQKNPKDRQRSRGGLSAFCGYSRAAGRARFKVGGHVRLSRSASNIPEAWSGRRDDKGGAIRWCFSDPALADAFAQEFALPD